MRLTTHFSRPTPFVEALLWASNMTVKKLVAGWINGKAETFGLVPG